MSSAPFPQTTDSWGMLGIVIRIAWSSSSVCFSVSSSSLIRAETSPIRAMSSVASSLRFLLLADLLRDGVALAAQAFDLLDDIPPSCIEGDEAIQIHRLAPLAHLSDDEIDVLSEIFDIQHGPLFLPVQGKIPLSL